MSQNISIEPVIYNTNIIITNLDTSTETNIYFYYSELNDDDIKILIRLGVIEM